MPLAALAGAEEAFLTGTTRDVQPIRLVDGVPLPAMPGPLTRKAAEIFADARRPGARTRDERSGQGRGSVAAEESVQLAVQVDELAFPARRDDLEGAQQEPGQRGQRRLEVRLAER